VEPATHKGRLVLCEDVLQPSAARRTMITAQMPRKGYAVTRNLLEFLLRTGLKPRAPKAVLVGSDIALKGEMTLKLTLGNFGQDQSYYFKNVKNFNLKSGKDICRPL